MVQALKHVGVGPRTISSDPDLVLRGRRRSKSEPRESSTLVSGLHEEGWHTPTSVFAILCCGAGHMLLS